MPTLVEKDTYSAYFDVCKYQSSIDDVCRISRFHSFVALQIWNKGIVVYRLEESSFVEVASFPIPDFYHSLMYMEVYDDVDLRPHYEFTFWTEDKPGMGPHLARFDDQGTCIDTAECKNRPYIFQLDQDVAIYARGNGISEHFQEKKFTYPFPHTSSDPNADAKRSDVQLQ